MRIPYLLRNVSRNMIEVYLYGNLKETVKNSIPDANNILMCNHVDGEHFQDLLHRLGLKMSDVGDCYINNALAKPENEIRDRDTIELNQHI
ncbi:MAG: hypothetical protein ACFFEU_06775 [Candidatus Thorarchaeota archaeon]